MNQKKLRYLLLGLVVLIWGLIIFRVVTGLKESGQTTVPTTTLKSSFNYKPVQDSFILFANYPDPFIPNNTETHFDNSENKTIIKEGNTAPLSSDSKPKQPAFDPNLIKYKGMIANPETKKKIAIVNIEGKEYLVKEQEKKGEYQIKKIEGERIIILFKGRRYTIGIIN